MNRSVAKTTGPILVVDDDAAITASLALLLKQAGYRTLAASNADQALQCLADEPVSLVLQDMNFSRETSGDEGLSLLAQIRARRPLLPVILMTAWGTIALAVKGMQAGASDFVTKPWSQKQLLQSIETALGLAAAPATREDPSPRAELDARLDVADLVGEHPKMRKVLDIVGRVSPTDASVLITGESGTGKELVAAAIHKNSLRARGPFVRVNVGGIPAPLFESEMFGHVKGAFTDAKQARRGRFELSDGGTIFLDEIGELDLGAQVKLLRVLQDRTYEVLGSSITRTVDVRVVSATNRDLAEAAQRGAFREDLFYRLNLIAIHLPPLRARREDIPLLAGRFLEQLAERYGRGPIRIAPSGLRWLGERAWAGNVRELRHVLERTVLLAARDVLSAEDFEGVVASEASPPNDAAQSAGEAMTIDEMERAMIVKALERHSQNLSKVAESLGMSRAALYRRLEKYGIDV